MAPLEHYLQTVPLKVLQKGSTSLANPFWQSLLTRSNPGQHQIHKELTSSKVLQLGFFWIHILFESKQKPKEHLKHFPVLESIELQLAMVGCDCPITQLPSLISYPAKHDVQLPFEGLKVLQAGLTAWHLPLVERQQFFEQTAQSDPLNVLQLGSKLLVTIPGRQVSSIIPKPGQQLRQAPVLLLKVLQLGLTGWQMALISRQYLVAH